jgi:hypothetical protein
LDLVEFFSRAGQLTDRSLSLYTLPISGFGKDSNGSDINLVDLPTIRRIVHDRFFSDTPGAADVPATAAPTALPEPATLDVVNATSHDGLAAALEETFADRGFTRGTATTAAVPSDDSAIEYGPGADRDAQILADQLRLPTTAGSGVAPGTIRLTVGAQFPASDYITHPGGGADGAASGQVTTVAATGSGTRAPAPTDLSQMSATDIPCVK